MKMKRQALFIAIAAVAFLFAATSFAAAQTQKYKVGDRVECDYLQNGKFEKGTVVPFFNTDLDKSGRWYRVRLDGWSVHNTMECMATHLRPITTEDKPDDSENVEEDENRTNRNNRKENQSTSKNKATKYKPGDRVECDKAQIGFWEKGTVVHFLQNDLDKESGRYYRVKLDKYADLYPEGHECMTTHIRPLGEAALEATGKYKAGDKIEAHSFAGAWLPATIIGVEGAFYKVRFDNYDSRHDELVDEARIRPLGTGENQTKKETEKPIGKATKIPGTAWKVSFYNKGETPPDRTGRVSMVMLFCSNGKWDNVRPGLTPGAAGAVGMRGTYKVAGNQLTTTADTGKRGVYRMKWVEAGKILDLDGGSGLIMRLTYNGETQCK